jgi:hypothetical protein
MYQQRDYWIEGHRPLDRSGKNLFLAEPGQTANSCGDTLQNSKFLGTLVGELGDSVGVVC